MDGIGRPMLPSVVASELELVAADRLQKLRFRVGSLAVTGLRMGQSGMETTALSRHRTTRSPKPPHQRNSAVMYLHGISGSVVRPLSGTD